MILRVGSSGAEVEVLQSRLNKSGFNLDVDGSFGSATERAVIAFQLKHNLKPDGVVGPRTLAFLEQPVSILNSLTEEDYMWAAEYLQDDVASIKAVKRVEAPRGGFLEPGKPIILFERHVMYKRLKINGFNPDDYILTHSDIVNKTPGGYLNSAGEYNRLTKAIKIDERSALESCSWGAYQIMGYHWAVLGFKDVFEYVAKNKESEFAQLQCFVKFIKANPILLKAIRANDWVTFARNYNGPDYKKNNYDVKLAEAFKLFGGK